MARILVINPNSSKAMTQSMAQCLTGIADKTNHQIDCIELAKSPPGINTDEDAKAVVPHIIEAVDQENADAIVIGCFSDPGIQAVREKTSVPVFGIAQSAYLTALGLGQRFGILSMGPSSIGRHLRYLQDLNLERRMAGDRAMNLTVEDSLGRDVFEKVSHTANALLAEDGADVLILGCAGLGRYRADLQQKFGVPVIDPVQAGVQLAVNALDLNYGGNAHV